MKRLLFLSFAMATLFACNKTEAPVTEATPPAFDNVAFQRQLDEMSELAIRKYGVKNDNARLPRWARIAGADILGGLGGASSGAVFGTPGIIVGGVVGAVIGSFKAAEDQAIATGGESSSLTFKLNMASNYELNDLVRIRQEDQIENPYLYYGEFHNYALADLGSTLTGTGDQQVYNHGRLLELVDNDATFQPVHQALQEAGGEFTLADYIKTANYFVDTASPLRISAMAITDGAYLADAISQLQVDGAMSENVAGYYTTFFNTLNYMTTLSATRSYLEGYENQFLHNTTMPEADRTAMLKTLAVARYSFSFWYTLVGI